jgi:hypothetical protein
MFAFARHSNRHPGAKLALAAALMCGAAIGTVALEAPAHAQKKKQEEAPKANYSKKFIAAYKPVEELINAGTTAEAQAKIPGVIAAIETEDDRNAAGGMIFNLGIQTSDTALQRQGIDLMIASGRGDAAKMGQYHFTGYQLANQANDSAAARKYLEAMIAGNLTFEGKLADGTVKTFAADDMHEMIAQSYFDADDHATGLDYLQKAIATRAAAGQTVPQSWITRGLSVAYTNELTPQAVAFGTMYVEHHPSDTSWGDAIAIQRNMLDYDAQATLDLLRLASRTNAMRDARSYVDYIDAADARRLPGEVRRIVDMGVAAKKISASDVTVKEASDVANSRLAADKADLPALERDAQAAGATAVTASAAGDVFLSYGEYAKAETMYANALTKPGVDTARVLTRLGIAQAEQGKSAEAQATFAKIQGDREAIAKLWALYAKQKGAGTAVATTG